MEPKFKTSFIPKTPMAESGPKKKKGGGKSSLMGLVTLITLIIFLAAIALGVGVFLYQQFLEQSIESKSQSLERARAAFEPAVIEELARLDKRIDVAQTLLANHTAPSALFAFLEDNTLQTIQFTDFRFSILEGGQASVSTSGVAASFSAVVLQSDVFSQSRAIRNPIFSNLNLNQEGDVVFEFSAEVDPSLISYSETLGARPQPAPTSGTTSPAADETSE